VTDYWQQQEDAAEQERVQRRLDAFYRFQEAPVDSETQLRREAQVLMDTLALFADMENWHSEWTTEDGMIHYWVETDGKPWEIAQAAINQLRGKP